MKKITLLLFSVFCFGICCVNGQHCDGYKKAHCDKYAKHHKAYKKHCGSSAAVFVAASNEDIISNFDAETSTTNYYRKVECPLTGSMTYLAVSYNKASGAFVCDPSHCKGMKDCKMKCPGGSAKASLASVNLAKKSRT